MLLTLFAIQLVLCGAIVRREVFQLQLRNLATGIFYLIYGILFVIVPIILELGFGGAHSINPGRPIFFTDPYVYYLVSCYGILLMGTTLLLGRRKPPDAVAFQRGPDTDLTTYMATMIMV